MSKRMSFTVSMMLMVLVLPGCGAMYPPLEVVDFVDLERYAGKWYEIARYPTSFERDCVGVTAEYSLRDDGKVDVVNTCRKFTLEAPAEEIEGVARVVDPVTNAKLKVQFFWPFEGDYWIIELDENYQYAVVGSPDRRFLWILSRTPAMDADIYEGILETLPEREYDPDRLLLTPQASADDAS